MTKIRDLHQKWMKEPEYRKEYEALGDAIERGIADVDAGRGRDLDEVCDELEARYTRMLSEGDSDEQ